MPRPAARQREGGRCPSRILHERALGDLELEGVGRDAGPAQHRVDQGGDVRPGEVLGRDVEAHEQGRLDGGGGLEAGLQDPGHDPADRVDHPGGDREDQAVRLGGRDEGRGRHEPALGIVPADQGLEAGEPPGGEPHDRLQEQRELVPGQGPPQGALLREGRDRRVEIGAGGGRQRRRRPLRHGRPEARQGLAEPGDEPLEAEAQDRVGAGEPLLNLRRAHGDEHAIRLGTRARGAREGVEDRHLAEDLAGPAPGEHGLSAVAPPEDRDAAAQDQVGAVPDRPLVEQDGAGREGDGIGEVLHRSETLRLRGEGPARSLAQRP